MILWQLVGLVGVGAKGNGFSLKKTFKYLPQRPLSRKTAAHSNFPSNDQYWCLLAEGNFNESQFFNCLICLRTLEIYFQKTWNSEKYFVQSSRRFYYFSISPLALSQPKKLLTKPEMPCYFALLLAVEPILSSNGCISTKFNAKSKNNGLHGMGNNL